MSGFVRKILIFITGYAWLLVLLGPGLIGMSIYSGWKADGDHAFTAKEQLTTVTGKVVEASEVTVKRRRRATKHYYQINVQPASGAEVQKLRIDFSTPKALVASMIDENVTALADMGETQVSVADGVAASQAVATEIAGIQGEIVQVVSSIRDIAESTREQSVATNEMAKSAEEVNRMTMETDRAVQSATQTVSELSALSQALHGVVGRFRL